MKKLVMFSALLIMVACAKQPNEKNAAEKSPMEITSEDQLTETEKDTKASMEQYIEDLNAPDWKDRLGKYWSNDGYDQFVQAHGKFREAYTDFNMTIKHLVVTGRDGILWGKVSAVHSGVLESDIAREIKPTGKPVEWDEVWFFEVVDGKQGQKWDFLKDDVGVMRQLGIKCLPK